MGIDGLFPFLTKHAPEACMPIHVQSMAGKTIGIDASHAIYEWVSAGTKYAIQVNGRQINHLQGILFRTATFRAAGAEVIYVFDGRPPPEKARVLAARRAAEDARPEHARLDVGPAFIECREMLQLMGIPFMTAPGEAEAQLAVMARDGIIDYVATEDSDAMVFGAPILVRDASTKVATQWQVDVAIQRLELTREQFIELCIFMGCDYATRMRGVGPARALQLLRKHGSASAIFTELKLDPAGYPAEFTAARKIFIDPVVTRGLTRPRSTAPDRDGLARYLATRGLASSKILAGIDRLSPIAIDKTDAVVQKKPRTKPAAKPAPKTTTGAATKPAPKTTADATPKKAPRIIRRSIRKD